MYRTLKEKEQFLAVIGANFARGHVVGSKREQEYLTGTHLVQNVLKEKETVLQPLNEGQEIMDKTQI